MARALTGPQKRFCLGIAEGLSQKDAYLKAYPKSAKKSAEAAGSRLLSNVKVQQEVARLQKQVEEKSVLTRLEKRQFLARVVRADIASLDRSSDLVDEWSETTTQSGGSEKIKMVSKATAIQIDNRMAGHEAPEKVELTASEGLISLLRSRHKQNQGT